MKTEVHPFDVWLEKEREENGLIDIKFCQGRKRVNSVNDLKNDIMFLIKEHESGRSKPYQDNIKPEEFTIIDFL